ncbi:tetratricopeptide repeat protein [Bifidobacterium goeldii]|uniref:Tetratricopeptide repeat protein n=2 Tax=Bifidobacterium goeldii TaxID=2306975 RepID=A0A430FK32_9BIFI|nr:tetratricopeptide repeat protein [Bifidobacterium goeldii]
MPTNPFAQAMDAAQTSSDPDTVLHALSEHAIALTPLTKRRAYASMPGVPEGLSLGWAQLPSNAGMTFSIGLFTARDRFAQIALADGKGRVFVTTDPELDTHGLDPRFMFVKEDELTIADGPRLGHRHTDTTVHVIQGGIVGRDTTGRMSWLASWLKHDNRYTLEQLRAKLPDNMRHDLEYRDAITIGFLAAYMLPQMSGLLLGFGSGNIFRRLNREAPIGAIRRSVRDTLEARAHGLRASGLEDHFADLMNEAGALDITPALEPKHGAEPLHLYTSSYSGGYFFAWDAGLEFSAALKSLRIEGNLNRFASVSAWLERCARTGTGPTEDTVTRAQAAQIDLALIANPALLALPWKDSDMPAIDVLHDDGSAPIAHLLDQARATAQLMAESNPDPIGEHNHAGDSEWLYRQTLSLLIRRLRLPYRFDLELRTNLSGGLAAIAFTAAGKTMMPMSRYDERTHDWVQLSDAERVAMSTDYNLRVGLMLAALAFGADSHIREVSIRLDSIGLEEAVAEQDSAIAAMLSDTLRSFERLHMGDADAAAPKDGDIHGDPTGTPTPLPEQSEPVDSAEQSSSTAQSAQSSPSSQSAQAHSSAQQSMPSEQQVSDDEQSVDRRFADLVKDVDLEGLDLPDFGSAQDSSDEQADDTGAADDAELGDMPADDSMLGAMDEDTVHDADAADPLSALRRNPRVRNLVTVTFTRDALLARLNADALRHPQDTYEMFDAALVLDQQGGFVPSGTKFDLRDARFSPTGSQEEPELSDKQLSPSVARVLGTSDAIGLSIQRADLLQRGIDEFHRLAADSTKPSVEKAQQAMDVIQRIADPELTGLSTQVTRALIDGEDTPDFVFQLSDELDRERAKARDMLFSGQAQQAAQTLETVLDRMDAIFADNPGVPRYFNSYAERVVYNRLFATPGEHTVLIPDNMFYAHTELAELRAQLDGPKGALKHLNAMVSYAPAYPLSHMRLAIQLARREDWDSARAACLNALRVALDRDDAAFTYYRFAYAEWMRDEFDVAVAAYIMSEHIAPGQITALDGELRELVARAESQCIPVPGDVDEAAQVLIEHDLPVWPHTEVAAIVRDAARVCVDNGMFVPARTLSMAAARMNETDNSGFDMVQAQFVRSLNS